MVKCIDMDQSPLAPFFCPPPCWAVVCNLGRAQNAAPPPPNFQRAEDPPSLVNGSVKTDLGDDDRFHGLTGKEASTRSHSSCLLSRKKPTTPESEDCFASGEDTRAASAPSSGNHPCTGSHTSKVACVANASFNGSQDPARDFSAG
jgi:hypothetical protein